MKGKRTTTMCKRSIFTMMLAGTLSLPAFANITDESVCDVDTLGIYNDGGTARVEAIWIPSNYTCPAGQYLNALSAGCADCPVGSFCEGLEDVVFNDNDQGLGSCPENYTSLVGAAAMTDCYTAGTASCALKNPYSEHGTANYANETGTCKTFYNTDVCVLDNESDCAITSLNCNPGYVQDTVDEQLKCVTYGIPCEAGTYLKAGEVVCSVCPADSYCEGDTFIISAEDQGITPCPDNLTAVAGSSDVGDCGRMLHIGNSTLHLHANKYTTPSLVIDVDGATYYANMTPVSQGAKTMSTDTDETLHIKVGDVEYTVHDTNVESANNN